MQLRRIDLSNYDDSYQKEIVEIQVVLTDGGISAGKAKEDFWESNVHFLAYENLQTKEVTANEGRLVWPITDEEKEKHGIEYPYFFKPGTIYTVQVRKIIPIPQEPNRVASFYNRFLVVNVQKENAKNETLNQILEEYRKPTVIQDDILGTLTLNKDLNVFKGRIQWQQKERLLYLYPDNENKKACTTAQSTAHKIYQNQNQLDEQLREFAAQELTDLANDWLEEEDDPAITPEKFAQRIKFSSLTIRENGSYEAYYTDDDMFYGHIIEIQVQADGTMESAHIAG